MQKWMFGAVALAAIVAPHMVVAQTTYSDRASFSAAAGSTSTETFSGCGTTTVGFSGNLSSTTGPCTGILPGVTYSPQGGSLYIAAPGQSGNPTTALGLDLFEGDPITVTFDRSIDAFGADLFQNFVGGTQSGNPAPFTLSFLLGGTSVATYNIQVASGVGSFFGLTGASFDTVQIAQNNGYAVIDNVTFGPTDGVPEPATWAMMIGGIGLAGGALRRRKPNVSVRYA